ncbi:hypothetical protein EAF04_007922 [Stromatinia cepivora]|nr:hypothetical protein EAF04_007922 [Stromatinia cepivora]
MPTSIQSTFFLFLLASTSILANPIQPKPPTLATELYGLSSHQVMNIANDAAKSQASITMTRVAISTGTATPCSPEVQALASGINSNIADQRKEQAAVKAVGKILQETPLNSSMFDAAKSSLLKFVKKGIAIRENNQKITPAGNAAIPGLATVAMAQQEEFNLTMSLTASDPAGSNATVAKLKKDFAGGIVQNMKNLASATIGCKMPSPTA